MLLDGNATADTAAASDTEQHRSKLVHAWWSHRETETAV